MSPETDVTERSLSWRILAHSRETGALEAIRHAIPGTCDTVLAVTPAATFDELRARHFDLFVTDEPALILVIHDRFPSPEARGSVARWFFKTEYAYEEFLREYHDRFHELSPLQVEVIPTILLDRYADSMRRQLYPRAAELATFTFRCDTAAWQDGVRASIDKLMRS